MKEDDFEELLSNQGFASRPDKKGPRTIAEMRREEMTKETDPLKLQVLDFKYSSVNKKCGHLCFLMHHQYLQITANNS